MPLVISLSRRSTTIIKEFCMSHSGALATKHQLVTKVLDNYIRQCESNRFFSGWLEQAKTFRDTDLETIDSEDDASLEQQTRLFCSKLWTVSSALSITNGSTLKSDLINVFEMTDDASMEASAKSESDSSDSSAALSLQESNQSLAPQPYVEEPDLTSIASVMPTALEATHELQANDPSPGITDNTDRAGAEQPNVFVAGWDHFRERIRNKNLKKERETLEKKLADELRALNLTATRSYGQ